MSLILTWGLGPNTGGGGGVTFTMRAYHTLSPIGYVYWDSPGVPDGSAALAPYPAIELIDVVIFRAVFP